MTLKTLSLCSRIFQRTKPNTHRPRTYPSFPRRRESKHSSVIPALIRRSHAYLSFPRRRESKLTSIVPTQNRHSRPYLSFPRRREPKLLSNQNNSGYKSLQKGFSSLINRSFQALFHFLSLFSLRIALGISSNCSK